jgi:hypothetical protein
LVTDWGAALTYGAINAEPERFARAVTMAVPPLGVTAQLFFNFTAAKSLWYMFYFQLPFADMSVGADELRLSRGPLARLVTRLRRF